MLGPIHTQMGGDSDPNHSGSGGGSDLSILNNVNGYILKATGVPNQIAGVPQLVYNSTSNTLSSSANLYVSGATNYLYLHGTDATGQTIKFKVNIQGSILEIAGQ
jgi:hypothetical protein